MASFVSFLELAGMRVFTLVAAGAILGQLLSRGDGGVAGVTIDLGMRVHQRKLVLSGVVVVLYRPMIVAVTVAAFLTESGSMRVVGFMTAVAVLGDLILVVAAPMAGDAVDAVVHAQQFVARLLEVVVLRRPPLLGNVAFFAVLAPRAPVLIVGGMAAIAGFRRLLVMPCDVTGVARHGLVSARQLEVRLVVIELSAGPARRAVAFAARLRELPVVHVVVFVAPDAGRGGLAPGLAFFVACLAGQRRMRLLESEVGEAMIELRAAELHDVGLAALMLGMASPALADTGVRHPAVIALMLLEIRGDGLVAIHAQRGLGLHVGPVMAVRAVVFLFYVRARHLARHQQRFHVCRERTRKRHHGDGHQPTRRFCVSTSQRTHHLEFNTR